MELNIISFGGVATGSIKAHDAEMAAPAGKGMVSRLREAASVIRIGSIIIAVAVFEIHIDRKAVAIIIPNKTFYVLSF